jgi:hypothetical protein
MPNPSPTSPDGAGPVIDLVYAWVDGDDPGFRAQLARHARTPADTNPERTRDLYDLLRYSLRSVAAYAPWVRHVWVVTARPQIPSWLDTSNPRVSVVHHDELEGFAPYLPTFNSTVIESFVHAIHGLADHFLYLNDDFLLGAPNAPDDYIAPDGKHLVYGTHFGMWLPFRIYRARWKLFNTKHLEHSPRFVYKPYWREMLDANRAKLHRTRSSRFREGGDLRMDRLYRMWMLGPRRRHARVVRGRELLRIHRFHQIDNDPARQELELTALRDLRPKFYCLNDDQGAEPDADVCHYVRAWLDAYYPEPSEFERSGAS